MHVIACALFNLRVIARHRRASLVCARCADRAVALDPLVYIYKVTRCPTFKQYVPYDRSISIKFRSVITTNLYSYLYLGAKINLIYKNTRNKIARFFFEVCREDAETRK